MIVQLKLNYPILNAMHPYAAWSHFTPAPKPEPPNTLISLGNARNLTTFFMYVFILYS